MNYAIKEDLKDEDRDKKCELFLLKAPEMLKRSENQRFQKTRQNMGWAGAVRLHIA